MRFLKGRSRFFYIFAGKISKSYPMKKVLFVLSFPALALINGCGGNNGDEKKGSDKEAEKPKKIAGMAMFHLGEHGLPLKMMVPEKNVKKQIPPPSVRYNRDTRKMRIRVGDRFWISIQRTEPRNIKAIKKDLQNLQQAFEFEFLEEKEDQLVYKKSIPNSDRGYYHFYKIQAVDGNSYVIRTNKKGEFSKKQMKRMLKASKTLQKAAMPEKEGA